MFGYRVGESVIVKGYEIGVIAEWASWWLFLVIVDGVGLLCHVDELAHLT